MKKKIFVCQCNILKMEEKDIHVFVSNHFYYHCYFGQKEVEPHDKFLVAICDKHPLYSDYVILEKSCTCHKLGPFEICTYCINVRYVLNFTKKSLCA